MEVSELMEFADKYAASYRDDAALNIEMSAKSSMARINLRLALENALIEREAKQSKTAMGIASLDSLIRYVESKPTI